MTITKIEALEKFKFKIYIDGDDAFVLYLKDIEKYDIEEGKEISEQVYEDIMENTVFRRAKEKALAILKFMDRTELELRKKLADAGFPEKIVQRTIFYVYEYGYINDERYASSYVKTRKNTKSKLVIRSELLQKGLKRDLIDQIFLLEYEEEASEDPELTAIRKAISKKTKDQTILTPEEKQKLMASLYRKGFAIDKIKKLI